MLKNIMNDNSLTCRAVVGFYRAQSHGDDIRLLNKNGDHVDTFHGLRQQVSYWSLKTNHFSAKNDWHSYFSFHYYRFSNGPIFFFIFRQADKEESSHSCLSDFIAPEGSGVSDYLGMFAVSCFGAEQLCEK